MLWLGFFSVCCIPSPCGTTRFPPVWRKGGKGGSTPWFLPQPCSLFPAPVVPNREGSAMWQRAQSSTETASASQTQREVRGMPFVIAAPCVDVLDQARMLVCPVACIQFEAGKDRKLYINPEECIDCGACEPVCPVEAIYDEFALPAAWQTYAAIDALWYRDPEAARTRVTALKNGKR